MNCKRFLVLLLVLIVILGLFAGCTKPDADAGGEPEVEPAVDFVVDVESGRDPVILQFTDTQIIDTAQMRTPDRLTGEVVDYWGADKLEDRCFKYLRETVNAVKPDLILMTGDNVYGQFDDRGTSLQALIEVMESFGIPWAPILGNHDTETAKGVDWQCEQYVNAKHCLFKQRELSGNGNYTVGIRQNGKITRVFFMLDTHSTKPGVESMANGHTKPGCGFEQDQIDWYTAAVARIRQEIAPDVKLSFAFHVPMDTFVMPLSNYNFYDSTIESPFKTILIDEHPNRKPGDFGIINSDFKGFDVGGAAWNTLCELGVDSVFVGHEHAISLGIRYQGIYIQFGQKSSAYDAINYQTPSGAYVCSFEDQGMPQVGGTVFTLSEADGTIRDPYIYLCKTE